VLLQVRKRAPKGRQGQFVVAPNRNGAAEIPMSVNATTVGSWVPREIVVKSGFLARCLNAAEGFAMTRALAIGEGEEGLEDELKEDSEAAHNTVVCRKVADAVLEIGLPSLGAGQRLLTPGGLFECLGVCASSYAGDSTVSASDAGDTSMVHICTIFLWAMVLDFHDAVASRRQAIVRAISVSTVALAMAVGHATGDTDILRGCYWCLREAMCGATGVLQSWLDRTGPVRLVNGAIWYKRVCQTPLRALSSAILDDAVAKQERGTDRSIVTRSARSTAYAGRTTLIRTFTRCVSTTRTRSSCLR